MMEHSPYESQFVTHTYYYPWYAYPDYYFQSVKRTKHDKLFNPYNTRYRPKPRISMGGNEIGSTLSRGSVIYKHNIEGFGGFGSYSIIITIIIFLIFYICCNSIVLIF